MFSEFAHLASLSGGAATVSPWFRRAEWCSAVGSPACAHAIQCLFFIGLQPIASLLLVAMPFAPSSVLNWLSEENWSII